jgi:DUF1680 family protein
MQAQVVQANSRVSDDTGRVAVQRGPLIYCLEGLDQPTNVNLVDVALDLKQKPDSQFRSEFKQDLLGGVTVLHHEGLAFDESGSMSTLYPRYTGQSRKTKQVALTFIPYYAWSNRQATAMQVWTPVFKA